MRDAANEERRRTVVGVVSALELEARLDPRMRHVVDGMRQQLEREYGGQITALKRQVREQMADEERVRREAMREARREVGVAHAEQVQRSEHAKQSARFEQMTNTLHAGHVKAEKARAEKWEKTAEHEARLRQLETANGAADKGAAKLLVREQQLRTASIERERGLEAENAAVKKENRDLRTASTTAADAHAAERSDLETALATATAEHAAGLTQLAGLQASLASSAKALETQRGALERLTAEVAALRSTDLARAVQAFDARRRESTDAPRTQTLWRSEERDYWQAAFTVRREWDLRTLAEALESSGLLTQLFYDTAQGRAFKVSVISEFVGRHRELWTVDLAVTYMVDTRSSFNDMQRFRESYSLFYDAASERFRHGTLRRDGDDWLCDGVDDGLVKVLDVVPSRTALVQRWAETRDEIKCKTNDDGTVCTVRVKDAVVEVIKEYIRLDMVEPGVGKSSDKKVTIIIMFDGYPCENLSLNHTMLAVQPKEGIADQSPAQLVPLQVAVKSPCPSRPRPPRVNLRRADTRGRPPTQQLGSPRCEVAPLTRKCVRAGLPPLLCGAGGRVRRDEPAVSQTLGGEPHGRRHQRDAHHRPRRGRRRRGVPCGRRILRRQEGTRGLPGQGAEQPVVPQLER